MSSCFTSFGNTSLHAAVRSDNVDMVEKVLMQKISPELDWGCGTALDLAKQLENQNSKVIATLLAEGMLLTSPPSFSLPRIRYFLLFSFFLAPFLSSLTLKCYFFFSAVRLESTQRHASRKYSGRRFCRVWGHQRAVI